QGRQVVPPARQCPEDHAVVVFERGAPEARLEAQVVRPEAPRGEGRQPRLEQVDRRRQPRHPARQPPELADRRRRRPADRQDRLDPRHLARVAHLAEEAATPPLDQGEVARIEAVLAVSGPAPAAVGELRGLARGVPGLAAAVDLLEARLAAFAARGIRPEALRFEASFGRTSLEYYDGMVFGALPRGRDDLPPLASGGRYDALTRVLGGGAGIPAVGGIVRPEALVALAGDAPCG
ncbi:MAG TPA: ATP phosphoribosyltransferase regulatory subunit, partial [Amaricoccus sp.]|nr:ATP phosphoribosyltransferase regulatory subunit [Amaricoccus sp.]